MTSQTSPTEAANLAHIAKVNWDAIVVGAGPAGVIAAHEVAKRGQRVLLVDKASFPRPKVCGGCLNLSMLATLERVGLTSAIHELDGVALNALRLTTGNHSATLPLPGGTSISREAMDAALIAAAVHDGVTFLSNTRVQWSEQADCRPQLELKQCRAGRSEAEPDKCIVATSVVVIASGLAGMNPFGDLQVEVEDTSLIGAGCVLSQQISEEACFDMYEPHVIHMHHSQFGYVGLVRVEDNRLNIAAAVQPDYVSKAGGLGAAIAGILPAAPATRSQVSRSSKSSIRENASMETLPDNWSRAGRRIAEIGLRGTPILTRRANRVAGPGFFVVGDAAGYVEPFTGEGMAWAALGGEAVAPLVCEGVTAWTPQLEQRWTQTHQRLVKQRQKNCRRVAWLLRQPTLSRFAVRLLDRYPIFATPLINRLNATAEV